MRLDNIIRLYCKRIDKSVEAVIARHEAEIKEEAKAKKISEQERDTRVCAASLGPFNNSELSALSGLFFQDLGALNSQYGLQFNQLGQAQGVNSINQLGSRQL